MHREWVLSILRQCRAAGAPFFFKQWGGPRKDLTGRELNERIHAVASADGQAAGAAACAY